MGKGLLLHTDRGAEVEQPSVAGKRATDQPPISVVLANYNQSRYLCETLGALLSQSLAPKEVIVIDDASTDDSVEKVRRFAAENPAVRLIRNSRNVGTLASANRGLEQATGEFIYVTAAHHRVLPGFFRKSVDVLLKHPQAAFCWSDPTTFADASGPLNRNRQYLSTAPCYFSPSELVELYHSGFIATLVSGHSSVMRRRALEDAGGLIPELKWHNDCFVLLVMGLRQGFCYIPENLAGARIVPNSTMLVGTRQWKLQRAVLAKMLSLPKTAAYRDVLSALKRSGYLGFFHLQILRFIAIHPEHWDYLSPKVVGRAFWYSSKRALRRVGPLRTIYRRLRVPYRRIVRGSYRVVGGES